MIAILEIRCQKIVLALKTKQNGYTKQNLISPVLDRCVWRSKQLIILCLSAVAVRKSWYSYFSRGFLAFYYDECDSSLEPQQQNHQHQSLFLRSSFSLAFVVQSISCGSEEQRGCGSTTQAVLNVEGINNLLGTSGHHSLSKGEPHHTPLQKDLSSTLTVAILLLYPIRESHKFLGSHKNRELPRSKSSLPEFQEHVIVTKAASRERGILWLAT